jgi:HlyD family secretion protein
VAGMSGWQIETDNFVETDVVHVSEGQPVKITIDALPGETLDGTMSRIKPRSVTKAGDVTYTAVVTLQKADPRLRWGMTTSVQMEPDK